MWITIGILAFGFAVSVYYFAIFEQRAEDAFQYRPTHRSKSEEMELLLEEWRKSATQHRAALEREHAQFFLYRRRVFWCMLLGVLFLFFSIVLLIFALVDFR